MAIALSEYLAWLRGSTTVPVGSPPRRRSTDERAEDSPGETGQGSSPETSDQSVGGRIGLANAMSNPNSPANLGLGLMGVLAGPLGLAITGIPTGPTNAPLSGPLGGLRGLAIAHNNAQLNAIAQNTPVGIRGLNADDNAPTAPPPDIPDDTLSVNPDAPPDVPDTGQPAVGQNPTGDNAPGEPGPGPGEPGGPGPYHQGGVVQDRRPGMTEPIVAQQGEFVVALAPAVKYRRLLEAINAGTTSQIKRSLKEALTRA